MKDDERTLLLRSFDEDLVGSDLKRLNALLKDSEEARAEKVRLRRMRDLVAQASVDRFEPHFADRVLGRIAALEASRAPHAPVRNGVRNGTPRPTNAPSGGELLGRRERRVRKQPQRRSWPERFLAALPSWRLATGLAAAAAVLVALGVVSWLLPRTTGAPEGQTAMLTLQDGTTIELSGGSTASYLPFWGRSERRVELQGEAFFNVEPGAKPFVVETFNADVTVLGTAFNVRAWGSDPDRQTEVTVASGRVAVEPTSASGVVLEAGQGTVVAANSASAPRNVSLDRALAWRNGGVTYMDRPLRSVFRSIERRFNVRIEVADPAINDRLLTYLNPRPTSAEAVLSDICQTLDLRFRRTANGYLVLPADGAASEQ